MRQYTEYPDYLAHFGIKGMKWGVRRFQNKDGSYTAAGLRRRFGGGGGGSRSGGKARAGSGTNAEARKAKIKKAAKIAAVAAGTGLAAYGAYRLAKSGKLKGASSSIKRLTGSRAGQVVDEARKPNAFKRASGAIKGAGDKIYNRMHGVRDVKPSGGGAAPRSSVRKVAGRIGGGRSVPRLTGPSPSSTALSVNYGRRPNSKERSAMFKKFTANSFGKGVVEDMSRRASQPRIGGPVAQKRSFRDRVKSARNAAQGAAGAAYGKLDNAYRSNRAVRYGVNAGAAVGGFAAGRAAGKAVNRAIGAGVKRADKRTLSGGKPTKAPKGASRREIKKAAKARYKADIAKARQDMRDWGDKYNARDKANKGYARSKSGALSAERAVTRYQKAQKAAKERYRNSLKRR